MIVQLNAKAGVCDRTSGRSTMRRNFSPSCVDSERNIPTRTCASPTLFLRSFAARSMRVGTPSRWETTMTLLKRIRARGRENFANASPVIIAVDKIPHTTSSETRRWAARVSGYIAP